MIIDHHQFKNALLHLSEKIQKEYPDEKFFLEHAILPNPEAWKISLFEPLPENMLAIDTSTPRYWVRRAEIGNEDILRLKDTFIEFEKVDMALELADWSLRTVDNVLEAYLRRVSYERIHIWKIFYEAKTDSDTWLAIKVSVNVEENRVVSSEIQAIPK